MIKFNDTNILVGYIKQLLHSFNLPKYKVYTKEQEKFHKDYLDNYKNNLKLQEEVKEFKEEIAELERINSTLDPVADADQIQANKEQITEFKTEIAKTEELITPTPEKNVLVSSYRQKADDYDTYEKNGTGMYPQHMRYIPYIKDNKLQVYAPTMYIEKVEDGNSSEVNTTILYSENDWKPFHGVFEAPHEKLHGKEERFMPVGYVYNLKIKNGTKNLVINNSTYDADTHEYLGDFLRFHRDYSNINLMPLYNCFSNRACPNLDVTIKVVPDKVEQQTIDGKTVNVVVEKGYEAVFKTRNTDYKIYMVPIKFFQKYTVAIDCNEAVEVFCGLYGHYQYDDKYDVIMKDTYYCFNTLNFNNPQLFDPTEKLSPYLDPTHELELAQHEEDLKLFIKVPASNKSAIVILEGDYRDCQMPNMTSSYNFIQNNPKTDEAAQSLNLELEVLINNINVDAENNNLSVTRAQRADISNVARVSGENLTIEDTEVFISGKDLNEFNAAAEDPDKEALFGPQITFNKSVINFAESLEDLKLITPLQLLYVNTGESYPFADRLIEYLVGNAITPLDTLGDNVKRVKTTVVRQAGTKSGIVADSLWDDNLRIYLYNYIMKLSEETGKLPHDILGYVDRFTETNYAYVEKTVIDANNKKKKLTKSISGINIYGEKEWED